MDKRSFSLSPHVYWVNPVLFSIIYCLVFVSTGYIQEYFSEWKTNTHCILRNATASLESILLSISSTIGVVLRSIWKSTVFDIVYSRTRTPYGHCTTPIVLENEKSHEMMVDIIVLFSKTEVAVWMSIVDLNWFVEFRIKKCIVYLFWMDNRNLSLISTYLLDAPTLVKCYETAAWRSPRELQCSTVRSRIKKNCETLFSRQHIFKHSETPLINRDCRWRVGRISDNIFSAAVLI